MKITLSPKIYQTHTNHVRGALLFAAITGLALIALGAYAVHTGSLGILNDHHGIALIVTGSVMTIASLFLLKVLKKPPSNLSFNYYVEENRISFSVQGKREIVRSFDEFKNQTQDKLSPLKYLATEMEREACGQYVSTKIMLTVLERHRPRIEDPDDFHIAHLESLGL